MVLWKRLKHPNVNTFRGTTSTADDSGLALAYNWAQNDNVMKYMKLHPNAPLLILVLAPFPTNVSHLTQFWYSCWRLHGDWGSFTH